jgi:hypothetical protein
MTPEEALQHAYAQDIARLPPEQQLRFNAEAMAAAHAAGKQHPQLDDFKYYRKIGHPSYQPQQAEDESPEAFAARSAEERAIQDQMLSGYAGKGWTPEQSKALGRTPESYEFSPGGQYLDQLENRNRLYDSIAPQQADKGWFPSAAAWAGGTPSKLNEGYAKNYAQQVGRTHAYIPGSGPGTWFPGIPEGGVQELWNPENFVGSFTTKMGGAVSDGMSQLGTALLRGTDPTAAAGNAAVRSQGSDFFRTNPVLAKDHGWRGNDGLIQQGQNAWYGSEGMSAGDTFRGAVGNRFLPENMKGQLGYAQPVINAALSFLNGMADGTGLVGSHKAIPNAVRSAATATAKTGIPGVARFAQSTADDIAKNLVANPTAGGRAAYHLKDEAADVTNAVELGAELLGGDNRSNSQWEVDQQKRDKTRDQSFKVLENLNSQIVRPQTTVTKMGNAIAPAGNAAYGAGSWLRGLISK